jgi:hypothetical protein
VQRLVRLTNAGTNGPLRFKGVRAQGQVDQFGVTNPSRGRTELAWSGGAWPALTAADLEIQPGEDSIDVRVFFEPTAEGEFRAELAPTTCSTRSGPSSSPAARAAPVRATSGCSPSG